MFSMPQHPRPNISIFMTNQQAQVVHPDDPYHIPSAANLAREGVLFTNVYYPTAHFCP
jgi:arylsulfatase A-like enzyme